MSQQAAKEAWIIDSGASAHMTFSFTGVVNYRKCERLSISIVRVAGGWCLRS